MESWFEIKVRAILGPEEQDDKEVVILGRIVRWLKEAKSGKWRQRGSCRGVGGGIFGKARGKRSLKG
eukprot:3640341-Karenia_brevis.AAC.1